MTGLVPKENQPLQIALSASSRTSLVSSLVEIASATTVRELLGQSPNSLRSWLADQRAKIPRPATQAQISAHLAKLIPHYWQPDMTDAQMRSRFLDFCFDLEGVTEAGLEAACIAYRREPKNKFFPTPGALLELCKDDIRERMVKIKAIDNAANAITVGLAKSDDRVSPLPSVAEVLLKHGKQVPWKVPPVPDGPDDEAPAPKPDQRPITDGLRDSPLARRSRGESE